MNIFNLNKLRLCKTGNILLKIFLFTLISVLFYYIFAYTGVIEDVCHLMNIPVLIALTILEFFIFWAGIILVYVSSTQLAFKWRVAGILCGMIPLVNLVMLSIIIRITGEEIRFESKKLKLNQKREKDQICKTKYPILLVHGVFFRDFEHLNYWGRIPSELKKNGAELFYGKHNSASSVKDSALELEQRIYQIIKETGAEKVNLIAHSKGGLDCRAAISLTEAGKYVASLTTINTPHRGCEFADFLLNKIPKAQQEFIAKAYNAAASKLGDINPDFIAAVTDLTASACATFNQNTPDLQGVFYQSVGSKLNEASSGQFPLNFSYHLVNYFDGPNDGLVGEDSFKWGENFQFLTVKGRRGISHGDMIDLNRQNIKGFDVREFFVQLVADLKNRGF